MSIQLLLVLLVCCSSRNGVAFVQQYGNRNALGIRFNLKNNAGGSRLPTPSWPTKIRSQSLRQQAEEEVTKLTSSSSSLGAEASRLQEQAQKMRLEAQKLDMALTSKKIEALEAKINNPNWLAKHPDEASQLMTQLQLLQDRLLGKTTTTMSTATATTAKSSLSRFFPPAVSSSASSVQEPSSLSQTTKTATRRTSSSDQTNSDNEDKEDTATTTTNNFPTNQNPLAGFDDEDLKAFVPVAKAIDERMSNGTMEERREAFRSAPELQEYFQKKIQSLLIEPMQEMQRLEELKREYLESTSKREKESLKRQLDKLERLVEEEGIFVYSDSIFCKELPQLSDQEINERLQAVGALPETLQSLYKHRVGVEETDEIRLAIEVEHYGPQLQLLEQIKLVDPIPEDMRVEFVRGYTSMPVSVQGFFVKSQGLEITNDPRIDDPTTTAIPTAEDVLKELERTWNKDETWSPVLRLVEEANAKILQEPTEYEDIEFVDRSRFLQEFFPAIANMEDISPDIADVEQFVLEILLDKTIKKAFMVSSKPERVVGGYYIRGTNRLEQNEEGGMESSASDQLVQRIQARLDASSSLRDKLEFFYILDPSPLSDEDIEMENTINPILLVTAKNRDRMYDTAAPFTKGGISLLGAFSSVLFSMGACALNPALSDRFTASLDAAAEGTLDLQWLADLALPTVFAITAIQLAHELAHRIVGWKDKVRFFPQMVQLDSLLSSILVFNWSGVSSRMPPFLFLKLLVSIHFTSLMSECQISFLALPLASWVPLQRFDLHLPI
jgi:hypothetical protein